MVFVANVASFGENVAWPTTVVGINCANDRMKMVTLCLLIMQMTGEIGASLALSTNNLKLAKLQIISQQKITLKTKFISI